MKTIIDESEFKHCEEFINDKSQPMCLRKFLLYNRIPAYWKYTKWKDSWGIPKLFATLPASRGVGGAKKKARRIRVNMASRFGDVGISYDISKESGYDSRVYIEQLTDFSENP